MTLDPLALEGWLYLARPILASLVVLFAVVVWMGDRIESARHKQAPLPGEAPPAPGWWLQVIDPGASHSISPGQWLAIERTLTLGRSPDCTVILEDPAVSALHAVVHAEGNRCSVEDRGSRNGTLVRGTLLNGSQDVNSGDEIALGGVKLRARYRPA